MNTSPGRRLDNTSASDGGNRSTASPAVAMIVGIGLIGMVSALVAAWFVNRHSAPDRQPADAASHLMTVER